MRQITLKRKTKNFVVVGIAMLLCITTITYVLSRVYGTQEIKSTTKEKNVSTQQTNEDASNELQTKIQNYLTQEGIPYENIALDIQDLQGDIKVTLNNTTDFTSASLYKVPLAMLYYEYIEDKTMDETTRLPYTSSCYEEGGPIGYTYQVGDTITLSELLYDMIVYSDNTAGHILFEHLGGWEAYRYAIQKYSTTTLSEEAIAYNVFPASFATDVITYLYEHSSQYKTLLTHMKLVFQNDYLNKNLGITIAQKYGSYNTAENAMGIVYGDHPYGISIMTSLGSAGIDVIGDINKIVYDFFRNNPNQI